MTTLARAKGRLFTCQAGYELPELLKPIPHPVYRHHATRTVKLPPAPEIPSVEMSAKALAEWERKSSAERVLSRCGLTREQVQRIGGVK